MVLKGTRGKMTPRARVTKIRRETYLCTEARKVETTCHVVTRTTLLSRAVLASGELFQRFESEIRTLGNSQQPSAAASTFLPCWHSPASPHTHLRPSLIQSSCLRLYPPVSCSTSEMGYKVSARTPAGKQKLARLSYLVKAPSPTSHN